MSVFIKGRRSHSGNAIAEFGPAMWIFLFVIIIPLVDLASLMVGIGTVMLVANLGVRAAVGARTLTEAVKKVDETDDSLAPFRNFAIMKPTGNATRGVALSVIGYATDGGTGATTKYSPPAVAGKIPVDRAFLDGHMYHFVVVASYDVSPLFNFNGLPFFSGIPGLGAPVPISYSATASVEHPEGLND